MQIITLEFPAVCEDCGKEIPAGSRARVYGKDKIYCESHDKPAGAPPAHRPQLSTPGRGVHKPATAGPAAAPAIPTALPVTREELVHLLEGVRFIVESVLDQLKET